MTAMTMRSNAVDTVADTITEILADDQDVPISEISLETPLSRYFLYPVCLERLRHELDGNFKIHIENDELNRGNGFFCGEQCRGDDEGPPAKTLVDFVKRKLSVKSDSNQNTLL